MIVKKDIQTFYEERRILLRESDFVYILPHPALRDRISNYTVTFPNKAVISDNYTVIPHGCATLTFYLDRGSLYGRLYGPLTKSCTGGILENDLM